MTRRVLVSYLSLALFVLILLEVPLGLFFADRERERFANGVSSDAVVLATLYEDALEQGTPADPSPAESYARDTGARVVVVDTDGISVVDTGADDNRDFSTRPEIATALGGTRAQGTRHSETLEEELLYVSVPVASGGVVHGALRVTLPTSDVDERVRQFWFGLVAVGAVVIAAVALLGWRLARSVTRPVRQLGEQAESFGAGDLDPHEVPQGAPEEIRQLAEAMNTMAERLRRLLDSQRAFVADASHQLRTPLTALRLRLENLEATLDTDQQVEVAAARDEIERLSELVDQLLGLARAEAPLVVERTDLVGLVRNRVDTWQAVAQSLGVDLTTHLPPGAVTVDASPGAIDQVLDNLIDNALSVSPDAGEVQVGLTIEADVAVLAVTDHGPGLSDEAKDLAVTRFWRGDPGRPGTGLGLPIVVSVAEAHGGHVELRDVPAGGLSVRVVLPVAAHRSQA